MQAETKHRAPPYSRDAEITRLAEEGMTASEIARALGCHPITVYNIADRLELRLTLANPRIDDDTKALALRMYREGVLVREISQRTGLHRNDINRYARRAGLPGRRSDTDRAASDAKIRRLHAEGRNDYEIARLMRISRETVRAARYRMELPRNAERGYPKRPMQQMGAPA